SAAGDRQWNQGLSAVPPESRLYAAQGEKRERTDRSARRRLPPFTADSTVSRRAYAERLGTSRPTRRDPDERRDDWNSEGRGRHSPRNGCGRHPAASL